MIDRAALRRIVQPPAPERLAESTRAMVLLDPEAAMLASLRADIEALHAFGWARNARVEAVLARLIAQTQR